MQSSTGNGEGSCCGPKCGCDSDASRRDFLRLTALGAAMAAAGPLGSGAIAGPFDPTELQKLVPEDKKLNPEWVKSLFARGERTVYRGKDLELIGMPVGGIGAGQLYLGGDGRLWHWDIFNVVQRTGAGHYAKPMKPGDAVEQGFALRIHGGGKAKVRTLDRTGFADVSFCGEYPIGTVEYRDPASPVSVTLEAFSPFVPLMTDDSSLPATVLRFTLQNQTGEAQEVEIAGWLQNVVMSREAGAEVLRRNRVKRSGGMLMLECTTEEPAAPARPDVLFEDFEKPTYENWTATGTAFGDGPLQRSKMPKYQGDVGAHGHGLVNSHNTRHGENSTAGDAHIGTLTSKPFTVSRRYIHLLVGGGRKPDQECVNVRVGGKVVRSVTGHDDNRMRPTSIDVAEFAGQTAQIQIVDNARGGWGNIGVDHIVFSDNAVADSGKDWLDRGTMVLALRDGGAADRGTAAMPGGAAPGDGAWPAADGVQDAGGEGTQKLIGAIARRVTVPAHGNATVDFVLAWHFPNLVLKGLDTGGGQHYGKRFKSAADVAGYVASNFDRLATLTRLWRDTWYDSTLPYWFLDRTFANSSILASSTCYRFANGRFYGWEGVGCCPGTCTHVWQYAQAVARLFPDLERDTRERVDFGPGVGFNDKTGGIGFRAEFDHHVAVDGQAGRILCAYREHQMSADSEFLKRNWTHIKKAMEYLIRQDGDGDGLLDGAQHNTLDADWYGPVSWLSSLYIASLAACVQMATDAGDPAFADQCRQIADAGRKTILTLFNGEYFYQKRDPKHPGAIGSGIGCEIDQVYGQSWADQVALGHVLPPVETKKALESLWKYNFAPDAGNYHKVRGTGRWYAMPGEAGLLMCTFPRGGAKEANGKGPTWATGYFNECMTGFEHQVASHMVAAGMLTEGLAVIRAVHDRYHASRRNPWNEVECGDHYARAMASYGVFITACGFELHGPRGHIGFAPRIGAENFKAPFTAPEGWGTFTQKHTAIGLEASIDVKFGKLRVRTIALTLPTGRKPTAVKVTAGGAVAATAKPDRDGRVVITLAEPVMIAAGQKIDVVLS